MKQLLIISTVSLLSLSGWTQGGHKSTSTYEAAGWKTCMLDSASNIVMVAPPSIASSKSELQTLKQQRKLMNDEKMASIQYWNAGAPAYRWNQIGPVLANQKMIILLRTPTAWMNIAIYNATILAWKEKVKYKRSRPGVLDASLKTLVETPNTYSYPCEHSVTAAAAATVLAYFFPEKKDSILALAHAESQSRLDAGVQFPSDVEEGWRLGTQVGNRIVEKAKNDGSAIPWKGTINTDPKKWTGQFAMGAVLSNFTPIVLQARDQFRPPPPPDFQTDMTELKNFKQTFKSNSLAYYWANSGGFDFWSDLAALKMFENRMSEDAPAVARIYTVLHTAYHDAIIAMFDAKYAYWGIRPVQMDTTYRSLIPTPPFPGYPSGHAMGAATTATVLSYFFPADAKEFEKLAQDCADSRFDAGIHFRTDNETGLRMGKAIGQYVVTTMMK